MLHAAVGLVAAVILDVSLSGSAGEDTLRQIHHTQPHLPVILSSGYLESDARHLFPTEMLAGYPAKAL